MFKAMLKEMLKQERSIYPHEIDDREIMVARKSCSHLYSVLGDLEFKLQNTKIVIKPEGYLYHMGGQNKDCFIGIESIPDSMNQFRLGTIFLRNFYVALDYELNFINIGVNAGSSERAKAYIEGRALRPNDDGSNTGARLAIILTVLLTMFSIAIIFFIKGSRELKKTNGAVVKVKQAKISTNIQDEGSRSDSLIQTAEPESLDEDDK
uniref:Peptidase A1 domain-containing protein n=1 Tax=Strombidium rassoulzadegani TaxID=1082188 RepID=A0A7S3FWG8_9SPIT|mmetsp:Transcript_18435/g.31530  ORF Transcript_18435/g.31530 Transcript_18435/m.31530 type:complete len:208 (+) Transcript_18435:884-1507(+)